MSTYEKISDTEYKEIKPQPPLEEITTLDALIENRKSIIDGLENNKEQVIFLTNALAEIDAKNLTFRALGVKTEDEL